MKKTTTFSLSEKILEELGTYCKNEGKGKSFVMEKALLEYFENLRAKEEKIKSALASFKESAKEEDK